MYFILKLFIVIVYLIILLIIEALFLRAPSSRLYSFIRKLNIPKYYFLPLNK